MNVRYGPVSLVSARSSRMGWEESALPVRGWIGCGPGSEYLLLGRPSVPPCAGCVSALCSCCCVRRSCGRPVRSLVCAGGMEENPDEKRKRKRVSRQRGPRERGKPELMSSPLRVVSLGSRHLCISTHIPPVSGSSFAAFVIPSWPCNARRAWRTL